MLSLHVVKTSIHLPQRVGMATHFWVLPKNTFGRILIKNVSVCKKKKLIYILSMTVWNRRLSNTMSRFIFLLFSNYSASYQEICEGSLSAKWICSTGSFWIKQLLTLPKISASFHRSLITVTPMKIFFSFIKW